MTHASENVYLAAYFLASGAKLLRIGVSRSNGRNTAVFEVESDEVEKLSAAFYDGSAVVNLAAYRQELETLKDQLFTALKQTETQRRNHETHRQGGARGPQAAR